MKFQSTKVFDGYSTVFRQWKAEGTHCLFQHGYGTSFKVWFEGELDEKNWVLDFGIGKRSKTLIDGRNLNDWLKFWLDHTVVIAEDDPELDWFNEGHEKGILQLRILPQVGAERFAEFLFEKLDRFVVQETKSRVRVIRVEFFEHEKNSAIVERSCCQ